MTEQNNEQNEQLIYESVESLKEYLPKLIQGIEKVLEYIEVKDEKEAFTLLVQVIEGLQWSFEVAILTAPTFDRLGMIVDQEHILNILNELVSAIQNRDLILMSDLLEYEILEVLRLWQKNLYLRSS